jgi:hypothetical protein
MVNYWQRVALELLDQSSAKFVLLMGTEARIVYEQHMRANKDTTFETVSIPTFLDGYKHTKGQQNTKLRPFAHLELDKDSKIKRIVIPIHHAEYFWRQRTASLTVSDHQHLLGIMERLIDFVNIMAYGDVHLPALLVSTRSYYSSPRFRISLHRDLFLFGNEELL